MKEIFGENATYDARSLDFLSEALDKANLPGFDYLEFKKSVVGLAKLNVDEATAFKAAYTTAATLGFTKEKLVETIGFYKNVLQKEGESFAEAMKAHTQNRVDAQQKNIERLRDQIERHKSEIDRLEKENSEYLKEIETLQTNVQSETVKIEKNNELFQTTLRIAQLELDKDLERVHTHLTN
jgi:chromosome segregation ATPase